MTSTESTWIEPYAGYEFLTGDIAVSRTHQAEKLGCIGVAPDLYGDWVDPSFYIGLGIQAGIASGISAEGNVNMLSSIVQHRPVLLDEALVPKGRIEAVDEVPRGHRVTTDVWFEDQTGERAVSVPRQSLKPDATGGRVKGAGSRPPPVIEDVPGLKLIREYQLTPEAIRAYSTEGNSIHYEMDAAVRAGFRAPIIGGGMGVHFLMAELWGTGLQRVDLEIFFRRPIFWDDHIQVAIEADGSAIALVKAGKVLTEARINQREPLS